MKKINQILCIVFIVLIALKTNAQIENCLEFDGVDDYVLIGDVNDLGTSDFTIEAWFYVKSTNGIVNKIVNKGLTSVGEPPSAGYALRAGRDGNDYVKLEIGNSEGLVKRLTYNGISLNQWYHVAGVRNKKKLYLYLNGELVKEDSTETTFNINTDIPLAIGAIHKGELSTPNEFMDGKIDEVRIWNVARTQEEIDMNKDCAITSPQAGLLAVYNLDESTGNVAIDQSGNNNDGILESTPIWVNSDVAPICITDIDDNIVQNEINVYPNPFKTSIFMDKVYSNSTFQVFDLGGRLLKSRNVVNNEINLGEIASGIYILEVLNGESVFRKKIIKK